MGTSGHGMNLPGSAGPIVVNSLRFSDRPATSPGRVGGDDRRCSQVHRASSSILS